MTTSMPIASMFLAVSMNVSPFDRLLPEEEKSIVSAPSRRAASEKLVRVRVEFSKNRLAQVRPARIGIFCAQLAVASLNVTALSRMMLISSADRLSTSNRCRRVQAAGTAPISSTSVLMVLPSCGRAHQRPHSRTSAAAILCSAATYSNRRRRERYPRCARQILTRRATAEKQVNLCAVYRPVHGGVNRTGKVV